MDRIDRLEAKVDAFAAYLADRRSASDVLREFAAIDAEPTAPPTRTDAQAYGDGRVSVWHEIDAILAGTGTQVTDSVPDRIRALIAERDAARAEISRLEARDREGLWIMARSAWCQPNIAGADAAEWRDRRASYLSGDPPKPDPLLVEARATLRGLRERDMDDGVPCWCRREHQLGLGRHRGYCDRARAILVELDARIGGQS